MCDKLWANASTVFKKEDSRETGEGDHEGPFVQRGPGPWGTTITKGDLGREGVLDEANGN